MRGALRRADWIRLVVLAGAVIALEIACRAGWIPRQSVLPPSLMAVGAWNVLAAAPMRAQILTTLLTVAEAVLLALAAGFALAALLHANTRLRRAMDPFLVSYYAVPTFIFYPLFIVLFGLNRWPLVAIGVVFAFVSVAVTTLEGLRAMPRAFLRTARVLRLSRWRRVMFITVPAIAPWLFSSVKFAIAYAFIGVIAGEFVLSGSGLGFQIAYAYESFDSRTMYGLILLLFLFVGGLNIFLWSMERRFYERRERG